MKKLLQKALISLLVLQALYLLSPSSAHAEEMTCTSALPVTVDIKPGDSVNKINLSAKGLLPVAVLTTQEFDASQFVPEMAHLHDATDPMGCTGAAMVRWNYSDVNGDGSLDLVFFFKNQELTLTPSSTTATLMAHGMYEGMSTHIMGTDSVIVKP